MYPFVLFFRLAEQVARPVLWSVMSVSFCLGSPLVLVWPLIKACPLGVLPTTSVRHAHHRDHGRGSRSPLLPFA